MKLKTMHKRAKRKLESAKSKAFRRLRKITKNVSKMPLKFTIPHSFSFTPQMIDVGPGEPEGVYLVRNPLIKDEIIAEFKLEIPDAVEFIMKLMKGELRCFSEPTDEPGIFKHSYSPAGKDYEVLDAAYLDIN